MATLQKIRSKGPLVVIAVGLALFAFIAGDAWRIIQPHQSQDVGEVNGNAVSAQEFQSLVEEFTEMVKMSNNTNSLSEEETNRIQDMAWERYITNKVIENEAEKLGLVVTDAEIQSIINEGTHYQLRNTPFTNPQTGVFDKDALMKFLADYSKLDRSRIPAQYVDQLDATYRAWAFIEKGLRQGRLQEKYTALIAKSMLSNPVEAQNAFDGRVDQKNILLAAVPYSSISDSTVTVTDEELKTVYDKKKERYKQDVETRNIRYIDVQVTASAEDRAALEKEMAEYTTQLRQATDDYTNLVRSTGSEVPYVDLYYTARGLPSDVVARLDSVDQGDVFGPYYNMADNTFNSFKKLGEAKMADSIQFRQIQVTGETPERTKTLADSIYNAIKEGADFVEIAKMYGQTGDTVWISSVSYEGQQVDGDNLKFLNAIISGNKNELNNLALAQANIILQVTDKKVMKDKYKVAIVKRPVEFSKETYNKAYNDFSEFIATNNTLEKVVANAEDAGYRLYPVEDLLSSTHTIGGIRGTKEALRWAFSAKPGEVSGLYECGDNDHLVAVAVADVMPEGYRPFRLMKETIRRDVVRDKKAEKIMADLKAAGVSTFEQYKGLDNAVSDSVKLVTFAAPAYIPALRSSEPMVSAYASVGELNRLSAPVKGNAGVMVLQPYDTVKLSETFDAATEENTLENFYARMAAQTYLNDLLKNADVKDFRYLFF